MIGVGFVIRKSLVARSVNQFVNQYRLGTRHAKGTHVMWFKKKQPVPSAPPPEHVESFVKWLIRYGVDYEPLRRPYTNNLDGFVELNWREIKGELEQRNLISGDALIARARVIAQFYADNFEKRVNADGGIDNLRPLEYQATVVGILVKMLLLLALAKFKYGVDAPDDFPGMPKA